MSGVKGSPLAMPSRDPAMHLGIEVGRMGEGLVAAKSGVLNGKNSHQYPCMTGPWSTAEDDIDEKLTMVPENCTKTKEV